MKFVENELGIKIKNKFLWCDSKPVLCWVKSESDQPRFVANRLTEIRMSTELQFSYIPTEENPADVASRGCTAEELSTHPLWWNGPNWLTKPQEFWPTELSYKIQDKFKENGETEFSGILKANESVNEFINFGQYKEWHKMVIIFTRVAKMCKKWLIKTKKVINSEDLQKISDPDYVSSSDYKIVEKIILRFGQVGWEDYIDKNNQIQWEKDSDGLIRLKTRLGKSETPELFQKPIVFPKGSNILEILIRKSHIDVMHERVDSTLNNFLNKFWSPGVRNIVKKVLKQCVICRKNHGPSFALPKMPSHPKERMIRTFPFKNVSLDYLGPSFVKKKKGDEKSKYWIVLITCLTTRGVYFEPVFDLTAESFLHVLRRFSCRRGKPEYIISDNAQTFKLAAKAGGMHDIKAERNNMNNKLDEYLTKNKIGWKFIPALSPWENGCAERLVKMCKDAFKSALGRIILRKEELRTFAAEVETILNSRPITYVSIEPDAERALRPIDFINPGAELGIFLSENAEEHDDNEFKLGQTSLEEKLKEKWKRTNKALDIFWERWNREYLLMLRNRNQWYHKGPRSQEFREPKIGEIVLMEDELRPRNVWPMARIVKLNGTQGSIRSVDVKTISGRIVERPVSKIYPLEASAKGLTDSNCQGLKETSNKNIELKEMIQNEKAKQIKEDKRTHHPMLTRAKAKILKESMGFMIILLFTCVFLTDGQNTTEKINRCKDCKIKCDSLGIILKTPKRIKKTEICCTGSCYTHSYIREMKYNLPREYLIVDHECTVTYWSRRNVMYQNKVFCPPVEKCDSIKILSWDMVLNPECWTKWTELLIGVIMLFMLIIISCIYWCVKSIYAILKFAGSCLCFPFKIMRKFCSNKNFKTESEMSLLASNEEDNETKEWIKKKRNRRLKRLSLSTKMGSTMLFMLIIIIISIKNVNAGAEVAVIQASSEDCIKNSNGTLCRVRGAAEMTILPAGQEITLALKNDKAQVKGSIKVRLKSLTLKCVQETVAWLREYKIKIKSARRCPTMGSCKKGRCANIRLSEKLRELKNYWNYPGNTYCMEGESIWGSKCALPSLGINECFFYKIIAVPSTNTVWKQVRCINWDYEIQAEAELVMGNMTKKKKLKLYPGITEEWQEIAFTPQGVTPPIAPLLDDYFIISDKNIIYAGKEVRTQLKCNDQNSAQNFECILGTDACKECWLNRTKSEEELVQCECEDSTFGRVEPKLPFTTDKMNLRKDRNTILSETIYTPIQLLVRVEKLKIVTEIEGNLCKAKQVAPLKGCYECTTGGRLNYTCSTNWGENIAEIKCPGNLIFLAKCNKNGETQIDVLPFTKSKINMECEVICPGGKTSLKIKGELMYIPVNERKYQVRNSEILENTNGFGLNWEDLFQFNWKLFLNPFQNFKLYILIIILAIFAIGVIYIFWLMIPIFNGYRFIIGILILVISIPAVSGGMHGIESINDSGIKGQRVRIKIGIYKGTMEDNKAHSNQSYSQIFKIYFVKMPSEKMDFLKFASQILACAKRDIGNYLQQHFYRKLLTKHTKLAIKNGARLLYRCEKGVYDILNGPEFLILGDRPNFGLRPRVPSHIFALQILRLNGVIGSTIGPTLLMNGHYYPLGGLVFQGYQDELDYFEDFFKLEMDKSDMEIMPQMGLGNEEVTEGENRITIHLDNNSSREWVLEFKNMGENGLKIIGKGKFKAVLNFVCLAICTLALLNGVHGMDRQPNGQKVPSESADDFEDFEMQQWQSELRDLQQIETAESTSGLNTVATNTGTNNQEVSLATDTVIVVPISEPSHQVRDIIENPVVDTNVQCVVEKMGTTRQLSIPTNLDLLNWAQIHRFLPPPNIMLKAQQVSPNVPLDQRPSTSANNIGNPNVSASCAPSCSSIQCGKYGKAIRNWDGRVARPVQTDLCRRERSAPYFRPRPIQAAPHQQPRMVANPPFPVESIPPIHVPSGIRREFLRRMSQETDHFFGLAQLVGEWNPTLATLFLALETFCRAILQLCVTEGGDHPVFSRHECRRR